MNKEPLAVHHNAHHKFATLFLFIAATRAGGRKLTLNLQEQTALISLNDDAETRHPVSAQPSSASPRDW